MCVGIRIVWVLMCSFFYHLNRRPFKNARNGDMLALIREAIRKRQKEKSLEKVGTFNSMLTFH